MQTQTLISLSPEEIKAMIETAVNEAISKMQISSPAQSDQMMRSRDVAKMLGISVGTVWQYAKNGTLPEGIVLSDKVKVWKRSDIEKFMQGK